MRKAQEPLNGYDADALRKKIDAAVHQLVNRMTRNLHPDTDYEIRELLTVQFRFWRNSWPATTEEGK